MNILYKRKKTSSDSLLIYYITRISGRELKMIRQLYARRIRKTNHISVNYRKVCPIEKKLSLECPTPPPLSTQGINAIKSFFIVFVLKQQH